MGEVVPARTSPTLLPHPLALCCHYPVLKCCSASIVVTSTLRVKEWQSLGVDQLFAEHVQNADKRSTVLLSLLFIACAIHGFLPVGLMATVIVSIIQNVRENISSKDNCRPIALTSTLSKITEKLILARCSSLLQTTENQIGFKSNSSTDLRVFFSLKQLIDYYKVNGSPVYLCFLDAFKAFDRVPHSIRFSKLVERKVPHIVISRLLAYWYTSQTFVIRWNNILSDPFTVSNCVQQGSILSPTKFMCLKPAVLKNIYIMFPMLNEMEKLWN